MFARVQPYFELAISLLVVAHCKYNIWTIFFSSSHFFCPYLLLVCVMTFIFRLSILLQFFTSLVISAVTGFQATINSSNSNSEMIIYFYCFCIFTQLFGYCWFGNEVNEQVCKILKCLFRVILYMIIIFYLLFALFRIKLSLLMVMARLGIASINDFESRSPFFCSTPNNRLILLAVDLSTCRCQVLRT